MCSEAWLVILHITIDLKKFVLINLFIFTTFTFESLKNVEDDGHLQLFSLSLCLNSTILSSRTLFGFTFSFDFPESWHLILFPFCQVPGVGDKLTNRYYWMQRLNPWEVTGLPTLYTPFSIVLGRKGSALKFSNSEVLLFSVITYIYPSFILNDLRTLLLKEHDILVRWISILTHSLALYYRQFCQVFSTHFLETA